ncbi:MAG: GerMN domain-containing protein [Lachnospiraceae bacterium]|nr:GerMN domain-containing protein [Lachnospiraceae bacterium]
MKKLKIFLSFILILLISSVSVLGFSGCGKTVAEEDRFMVFYANKEADDIIYKEQIIENSASYEQVDLIQMLLNRMFYVNPEETSYYSVKPSGVTVNGMIVKDGEVTIDFNSDYLKMSNVREIIMRTSIVLTLIQVNGITGVSFTVDGEPLTDKKGTLIGTMTKERFVDVLLNDEGMLKQESDLTIYFANETGEYLVPVVYGFTIDNSSSSMEEYIVSQLIAGPKTKDAYATMSKDVKVLSITTSDKICYVNFSSSFLSQNQPVSDELMVYSIVNSLCQLPYVNSVQFMVESESDIMLHKTFDLSQPLRRKTDLIRK